PVSDTSKELDQLVQDTIQETIKRAESETGIAKLCKTVKASEIKNQQVKTLVDALYQNRDKIVRMQATLCNSVHYQQASAFLMSRRILSDLVKNDPNTGDEGVTPDDYKRYLAQFCSPTDPVIR